MKKTAFLLLSVVVPLVVLIFAACEKDSDGNLTVIEAKNVINIFDDNSLNDVVNVKALIVYRDFNTFEVKMEEICSGKYENNGFKLTLSGSVSENYLMSTFSQFSAGTVSDPNAKYGGSIITAYDNKGQQTGYFLYASSDYFNGSAEKPVYGTTYCYLDRNVTVKGSYVNEEFYIEYDCSFKKGWNIAYNKIEYTNGIDLVTTTKPSGVAFQWLYIGGNLPLLYF
jgi:hypothetical protein